MLVKNKFKNYKNVTEPRIKVPKKVQDLVDVQKVTKSGIFQIEKEKFSKLYIIGDSNYSNEAESKKEILLLQYAKLLNSMGDDFKVIYTSRKIKEKDMNGFLFEKVDDGLDDIREEYNIRIREALKNSGMLYKRKMFLVTVKRKNLDAAIARFDTVEKMIVEVFKSIGSDVLTVNGQERIKLLGEFFSPEREFYIDLEKNKQRKREWIDTICPNKVIFRENDFQIEDRYYRSLFISDFPDDGIDDGYFRELMKLPYEMTVTIDGAVIPKKVVESQLKSALMNINSKIRKEQKEKASQGVYTEPSDNLSTQKEAIEKTRNNIRENSQKLFFVGITIVIKGKDKKELDNIQETIQSVSQGYTFNVKTHWLQQRKALITALPIGHRHTTTMRTLLTHPLTAFIPLDITELNYKNGIFLGTNKSGRPIFFDREQLENGNGMVFGKSGFGKSMTMKDIITQIRLRDTNKDTDIIIIDPQGEYNKIVNGTNGQLVEASAGSNTCVNPLFIPKNLYYESEEEKKSFMELKASYIFSVCELSLKKSLDGISKKVVNRCTKIMYEKAFEKKESPVFKDFRDILSEQPEGIVEDLLLATEDFMPDGFLGMFGRQTNIQLENNLIDISFKKVSEDSKPIMLLTFLTYIIEKVEENSELGRSTEIFADELKLLLKYKNARNTISEIYKTVRKLSGKMTGGTQNIGDVARNKDDELTTLITNSEFLILMAQQEADRDKLLDLLEVNDSQLSSIIPGKSGDGLMKFGNKILEFHNDIPVESKCYEMFNTDTNKQKEALKKRKS